jgi:integrase
MGTRNRKQVGYIYKSSGWWWLRFRQRAVKDGKLVTVQRARRLAPVDAHHKTKASVRRLAEQMLEPLNKHQYTPETVTTLGDFVERIYLPYVKEQKRPSTYKGYRDMWEDHLEARCATAWLREVRSCDIQRWLDEVAREDGLSKASLKHIKHLLSGIFRYAVQQDYCDCAKANPVTASSIPPAPRGGDTYAYSLEEIKRMLAVLSEPAATVVAVAAFTGLRRGEIRGLLWENYVPACGDGMAALHVSRSVWGKYIGEPKTEKSKAPVPVLAPLATMLEAHRLRCGNPLGGEPVFANCFGRPLDIDNLFRRDMQTIFEKAGIEWHGWHSFRRGLATNLHRLGVDDKTIQAIMRHSNISTTQNIYIKSAPADSIAAMKQLEALMCANRALTEQ